MLNEAGDGPSSDRNVFDAGADDVTLRHGDDVGHAVTGVYHHPGQCALANLTNQNT